MKKSDRYIKRRLAVFSVLMLLVVGFIFSQSLPSIETSGAASGGIAAFLKSILDPYDRINAGFFHDAVRKLAHLVEFTALGLCIGGFSVNLGCLRQRRYIALPMLIALLIAVADEFLQSFTGRGSMVTDVALDYAGALFGLAVTALIVYLCGRKQRRMKNEA